jgi:hypothetical protein
MSWMSHSPPDSPRAPKINQQSWDDSTAAPINLYDPIVDYYGEKTQSPSITMHRKVNYNKQHLPRSQDTPKSPKSPRHFDFPPHSPRLAKKFDFPAQQSSDSSTPGSGMYYDTSTTDVSPSTASGLYGTPKKYEYGAISPKFEKKGEFLIR